MSAAEAGDRWAVALEAARKIAVEVAAVHAADVDARARFPVETITALREARLLSALVPASLGGLERSVSDVSEICFTLGQHCAASAMVFAMHQIQVAALVRHGLPSPWFARYLATLAERQLLIASVTSEVGVGGDMRTSIAAVTPLVEGEVRVDKDATTISYGEQADELLITTRRAPDAAGSDQVLVLISKAQYTLARLGAWDTLGMRGTCSPGFEVRARCHADQVLPVPFADIAARTMVPVSHLTWSHLWLGIATDAVNRARAFVRGEARKKPGVVPPGALRLAELSNELAQMRAVVREHMREYQEIVDARADEKLATMGYAIRINNLKLAASQKVAEIVTAALAICGVAGYRNDTKFSLGRHLRDAHSAALMISNDRIHATNASLLLVSKDD